MRPGIPGDRSPAGLLTALLFGAGLGLLYELLRPLRHRAGRAGALLDVLFAILSGIAAFVFAMGAENGRMGQWELAAMLAGFLLWLHFLSCFKQGFSWISSWIHTKKQATQEKK